MYNIILATLLSLKIVSVLANSIDKTLMKNCIMQHFIWVFTVKPKYISIQRVTKLILLQNEAVFKDLTWLNINHNLLNSYM